MPHSRTRSPLNAVILPLSRGVIGALLISQLAASAPAEAAGLRTGEYLKTQSSAQIKVASLKTCANGLTSLSREAFEDGQVALTELGLTLAHADRFTFGERMTCRERSDLSTVLEVVSLTIGKYALITACTGVGVPVDAFLGAAALGTQFAQFVVSNMKCDDTEDEKKLDAHIKQSVCEALLAQGIACDPRKLQ